MALTISKVEKMLKENLCQLKEQLMEELKEVIIPEIKNNLVKEIKKELVNDFKEMMKKELKDVVDANKKLTEEVDRLKKTCRDNREAVELRTDRSLRKTLVFKGLPEK